MKPRFFWPVLAAGLLIFVLVLRAAQKTISVGTSANDATGDTVRVAFQKANSNFAELYAAAFTNGGAYALNGLTASNQIFTVGSTGTDFTISSAGTNHAFNLPFATESTSGKLSSSDYTTFNGKVGAAGNGMIKAGNFLHFAQSTDYTTGTIPVASGETQFILRTLIAPDIPSLDAAKITTGTFSTNRFPAHLADLAALALARGDLFYYEGTNVLKLALGPEGWILTSLSGMPGYTTNFASVFITNLYSTTLNVTTQNVSILNVTNSIKVNGKAATVFSVNGAEMPIANLADSSTAILGVTATTNAAIYPTNLANAQISGSAAIAKSKMSTSGTWALADLPAGTSNYVLTANGAGVAPSYQAAAAGGGSSGSTNYRSAVIALTMTGTNVDASQIDWLKTNVCYRLTLTGNAFFGDAVCINVPDTNSFQWLQLNLIQDSTGTRTVTFTNSIFAGVNGTFAITTNANAWDSLTLINSPQTNGNVAVLPSNFLHR